ncbi:hypothetical protein ACFVH6_40440 [Spirillospora sp. NPDC127200]
MSDHRGVLEGVLEEVFSRGRLQIRAEAGCGRWPAIMVSSPLSAAMQGYLRSPCHDLRVPIVVHVIVNPVHVGMILARL